MLDVLYLHRARADLIGIWRKTRETWGEAQADSYLQLIDDTVARIAQFPEIGSPRDHIRLGYRGFLAGRHMVYYRIQSSSICIVRILHERMDVAGTQA